jgi:hypothetical protein
MELECSVGTDMGLEQNTMLSIPCLIRDSTYTVVAARKASSTEEVRIVPTQ